MTTELPDTNDSSPATGPLALKSNEGLGLVPESAAFEAWFLERYCYSRAILTNPIWSREIGDAAEAFAAGQAAERERCAKLCADMQGRRITGGTPGAYWKREATPADCAAAIRGPNVANEAAPTASTDVR